MDRVKEEKEYDSMDKIEAQERRDMRRVAALDEDEETRRADYEGDSNRSESVQ